MPVGYGKPEMVFQAFATITGASVELYNTDGAQGAARAAGLGAGIYKNTDEAFVGLHTVKTIDPDTNTQQQYQEAYQKWLSYLHKELA